MRASLAQSVEPGILPADTTEKVDFLEEEGKYSITLPNRPLLRTL